MSLFDTFDTEPRDVRSEARTVPVLLPLALDEPYDYLAQDGLHLAPGTFVLVPLGPMKRIGVVWRDGAGDRRPVDPRKLKPILDLPDVPPLPPMSLDFADWVARYTLAPRGMVLQMMMSARLVFEAQEPRWGYRRADGALPVRLTEGRQKVLDALADGEVWAKKRLMEAAGVSAAVIDGLASSGALIRAELPRARQRLPRPDFARPDLSEAQAQAAAQLREAASQRVFSVSLLDGVTGSGKTEVYFEAVAEALRAGGQVLLLLPEIALTTQFLERFEARFGCRPAEWHSGVSAKERARVWRAVAEGEAKAVAGARSALFLPFVDLGLIVVDEEHDASFKQDDRVRYQARDMAVVRASLTRCAAILSSATPSIESTVNARRGRYAHVILPQRFSGNALPDVHTIDLKAEPPEKGAWLSAPLIEGVNAALNRGEQALLFLNRRGYAPLTLCRACGHRFLCPQCTAHLTEHRLRGRLMCHHCGFSLPLPKACPACRREGQLVACGPGIERVMEEVSERWPGVNVAVLSSDLVPTTSALREVLTAIANGDAPIIVGTQLVSKGHNFPLLSFVGVVDGDLSLVGGGGDPRAGERTFQLLSQVTGRAGRFRTGGLGLIQTHYPNHPVMQALVTGDRAAFYEAEIAMRETAQLPPFGRLAGFVVSARTRPEAEGYARALALAAPPSQLLHVLGPAEAPLAIVRGRHRQRLMLKAERSADIQAYVREWMGRAPPEKGSVKVEIDVDPYSFL